MKMTRMTAATCAMIMSFALAGVAGADGVKTGKGYAPAPVEPAPTIDWSGLYIGVGVGWIGADFDAWTRGSDNRLFPTTSQSVDSAFISGHIGVQHQFSNYLGGALVLGVEATIGDELGTDNNKSGVICPNSSLRCHSQISRLATVGGKLGYAFNSNWLFYGQGGYAHALLDTDTTRVGTGFANDFARGNIDGYYAGAGLEYAYSSNIILGVDYKHLGFEGQQLRSNLDTFAANGPNSRSLGFEADVVQARLTFKFDPRALVAPATGPLK